MTSFSELELSASENHHRVAWRIKRISWVLISIFLLFSLIGGFGYGYLSSKTFQNDSFSVEYEKVNRYKRDTEIKIRIANERAVLALGPEFLSNVTKLEIIPEPETATSSDTLLIRFNGNKGSYEVVLRYQFLKAGLHNLSIREVISGIEMEDKLIVLP